ncbi:MAG: hypothetical protein QXY96_07350 [Candidatus Methanomethylicaceae archaeon]
MIIKKRNIRNAVLKMLKINMGLKSERKMSVLTNVSILQKCQSKSLEDLSDMLRRLLAEIVYEIAKEKGFNSKFFAYSSVNRHSVYPEKDVEEKMKRANVIIAITTYSLTHTNARVEACKAGARVASMPTFTPEMFYPNEPMNVNYVKMAKETEKLAKLLSKTKVEICTVTSSKLNFSLDGREEKADTGLFTYSGSWKGLSAGEAYVTSIGGPAIEKL